MTLHPATKILQEHLDPTFVKLARLISQISEPQFKMVSNGLKTRNKF